MSNSLVEKLLPTGQTLQIAQGDLTLEETDAIVNAANEHLQHGGGVAWAIVRRGGDMIQEESDAWIAKHGLVPHSRPAWTSGGTLPARFVIHAVGPVWGDGDEGVSIADVEKFAAAARDAGADFTHTIYPGVGHGFLARGDIDDTDSAAGAAWGRTIEFFSQHLG